MEGKAATWSSRYMYVVIPFIIALSYDAATQ